MSAIEEFKEHVRIRLEDYDPDEYTINATLAKQLLTEIEALEKDRERVEAVEEHKLQVLPYSPIGKYKMWSVEEPLPLILGQETWREAVDAAIKAAEEDV